MNSLIYGKCDEQFVVSIEPEDDTTTAFLESPQGEITQKILPNRYWLLSDKPIFHKAVKLRGNLHYKWGKQFSKRSEFLNARQKYRGHDIYSIYDPKESFMVNYGLTYFKGLKVSDVSLLSFDIETNTLGHEPDSRVLLITNTYRKNGVLSRKLFSYADYANDGEMIKAWCNWVREINPSIVIGYNVVLFDLPYLAHVASLHGVTLDLGRNGSAIQFANYESQLRKDGSQSYTYKKIHIYGRELIDIFFVAIKYDIGRKYESYKLKQIVKQEGLEDVNRQHYDASKIRETYLIPEEWEKIKKYAENDADDPIKLFDLMIPASFYFCQSVPKSFQSLIESASGSQLNSILVRSYLQEKHSIPKPDDAEEYEGAISFGVPGLHHNIVRFDFSGMYPSIMLEYSIGPHYKDPNNNFIKMIEFFVKERFKNKKIAKETGDRYYKDLEQSMKIGVNSAYGMLGAPGLNFNFPKGASEVTKKGRDLLKFCIEWATGDFTPYEQFIKEK